jgi:hypothetical protein
MADQNRQPPIFRGLRMTGPADDTVPFVAARRVSSRTYRDAKDVQQT